jgi:hypothetical protein
LVSTNNQISAIPEENPAINGLVNTLVAGSIKSDATEPTAKVGACQASVAAIAGTNKISKKPDPTVRT